jgi:hypothetical protein
MTDTRVRTTAATLRADMRMRELLAILADRESHNICDLSTTMKMSRSGLRKYCYKLVEDHIVTLHYNPARWAFVTLTAKPDDVERYAHSFLGPMPNPKPRKLRRSLELMPGTFVHQCTDDAEVPCKPRQNATILPRRDPLVAALFGLPCDVLEVA